MQTQQVVLNSHNLQTISNASPTAEAVTVYLSQRERLRHFSDIHRVKNSLIRMGEKIVDSDYNSYWKSLQDEGAGVIVYGRKGRPDRFEWHYSMKKVAEAALQGKDVLADRVNGPVTNKAPKLVASAPKNKVVHLSNATKKPTLSTAATKQNKLVYIQLRKDFNLEFSIPGDISKNEIETISRILGRLSA